MVYLKETPVIGLLESNSFIGLYGKKAMLLISLKEALVSGQITYVLGSVGFDVRPDGAS